FPAVYNRKKTLLQRQWEEAVTNERLTLAVLKKNVSAVFYHLLILKEKEELLLKTDSLFQSFVERVGHRLEQGAADQTEKIAAEIQRAQIAVQLKDLRNEYELTLLQFQLILNAREQPIPDGNIMDQISH